MKKLKNIALLLILMNLTFPTIQMQGNEIKQTTIETSEYDETQEYMVSNTTNDDTEIIQLTDKYDENEPNYRIDEFGNLLEENVLEPYSVDHRELIKNTTDSPYSGTVFLYIQFEGVSTDGKSITLGTSCSGAIIDSNTTITAAHCITKPQIQIQQGEITYTLNTVAKNVRVFPGNSGSITPFGYFDVSEIKYPKQYSIPEINTGRDIALLTLEGTVPSEINKFNVTSDYKQYAYSTGYPGEKVKEMYQTQGEYFFEYNQITLYKLEGTQGQSGSPIYNAKNEIMSVMSRSSHAYPENFDGIKDGRTPYVEGANFANENME